MAVSKTYDTYTITAAGLTQAISVNDGVQEYNILASGGAVVLAGNIDISSSGTPSVQTTFNFRFGGGFTTGAFSIRFFGVALTVAQALYEQYITAIFNGSTWDVSISSDFSAGRKDINGADIVDASIPNAALTGSITLAKLANLAARGYIITGGNNGALQGISASGANTILGGDGTDILSQVVGGDITKSGATFTIANNAITTVKILDANVTPAKLTAELNSLPLIINASFETGEVGSIKILIPFTCTITNIYAIAVKAIAATDSGSITPKNNAGVSMTVTTPIVFAASDAYGTAYSSAVTANNAFTAGQFLTITTAKTTAGGKVLVTLTALRS